jgi:hypothetical protein
MPLNELWIWSRGRTLKASQAEDWLALFRQVGFTDVVFCLNDYGFESFGMYAKPSRIIDVARRYRDVGIRPHLMSWIKPDRDFILASADTLIPLCERAQVTSLMWDVEEYWTGAKADHAQVAHEVVAPAFASLSCPVGTTGITSIPGKVKPMVAIADYAIPQAYSFPGRTDWHQPGRTQDLAAKFWRPLHRPLVMGLAAYKQGEVSSAARGAMATCVNQTLALGQRRAAYWDCLPVKSNGIVRGFLTELAGGVRRGPSFLEHTPLAASSANAWAPLAHGAASRAGTAPQIRNAAPLVIGLGVLGVALTQRAA